MKKITFVFAVILSILAIDSVNAQYRTASYSSAALENKVETMAAFLSAAGYEMSAYDVDELSQGETYVGTKTFYGGNEYVIVAISEHGVEDLDIEVKRGSTTITKDTETGDEGVAMVEFYNSYQRTLDIKVKNYESSSTYREYDFVVLVAYK